MSVAIVGSINQDIIAQVSRIPAPGETVLASAQLRSGGGKGANQAVAACRAGQARVAFVGSVGTDADGDALRRALVEEGIDVSGLSQVQGPSGTALISVDAAGENAIVVVPGANAERISLTDSQRAVVVAADVLLTQLEIPLPLVIEAAQARSASAWHLLNAAPSAPLGGLTSHADLLDSVDVLIVNEHEALDIGGGGDLEAAIAAMARRVPALVVTLGHKGSLVLCGGARINVPAFPATAIDTTGAGDTFCGMFAAALASSNRAPGTVDAALLADAARAGAAAASLAVTRPGAQDAVPSAADVAALLEGVNS